MKRFALFIILTGAVSCCFVPVGWAQTVQDQSQSAACPMNPDSSFLAKAIEANAAEVELGRLAESKSQNTRIRAFAKQMVKDHTYALDAFHRLATGGVPAVPNQDSGAQATPSAESVPLCREHQQLIDRLSRLSGDDFDREYISAMVQEHLRDIREVQREAESSTDTSGQSTANPSDTIREKPQAGSESTQTLMEQQTLARDLLPILRMHLKDAEVLDRQLSSLPIPENSYGGNGAGAHAKTQ